MGDSIAERLSCLSRLSKPTLCNLWQQFFKRDPPPQMRKDLMLRMVAHRMQEQEFGGLSDANCRRLCELARGLEADHPSAAASARRAIKPGTRLMRQWKEQVHVVNVEEEGYDYNGTRYQSLSEIARLITGTRWSGPLFFGLKRKPSKIQEAHELRA